MSLNKENFEVSLDEVSGEKRGLNLTPNELVGYRLSADSYNWTLMTIKKYGKDSKFAGQEYEQPLGHFKNLKSSIPWMLGYLSKLEAKKLQEDALKVKKSIAEIESIQSGIELAEERILKAFESMEKRLMEKGINIQNLKELSILES